MTKKNELSQHIQDCIIKLAIDDDRFLMLTYNILKPEYFNSTVTEAIFTICKDFYINFKRAPKEHFAAELSKKIDESHEEGEFYLKYMQKINDMTDIHADYVLNKLSEFVKKRTFEIAAQNFIGLIEDNDYDKAKIEILGALNSGIKHQERGLLYLEKPLPSYLNEDFTEILLPTGISEIDKKIGGYRRKQLVVWIGSRKSKKSWAITSQGQMALIKGLNVLHITHELTKEEVEMRYDMMFGSLTSSQKEENVIYKTFNNLGEEIGQHTELRGTVFNPKTAKKLRKKIKGKLGKLIIKKYPMGTCTMEDIESYLDYLEIYENFKPHVLINDYVDIMSLDGSKETRHELNRLYIQHKKIADERDILVLTVSQTPASAHRKNKMSLADVSEDARKTANVDIALGIVETNEEVANNTARVFVLANRSGEQDFGCGIHYNVKVGQFCLKSWPLTSINVEE